MELRFGRCTVRDDENVLRCAGEIVPLPPKAIEALVVLAGRPGEVVSKDALLDAVWGTAAVEEANLTQNVYRLRRAFERHDPSVRIENIPRRGYRLVVTPPRVAAHGDPSRSRRGRWLGAGALAATVVLVGSVAFSDRRGVPSADVPPSFRIGNLIWSTAKSAADVRASIVYFDRAIAEQPQSPLGYAGLADARVSLALREIGTPQTARDAAAAAAAASRAVDLGPFSSNAHAALGQTEAEFGDPQIAERELRRAVELDPDSVQARTWYGELLMNEGRIDDAVPQFRAALAQNSTWTEAGDNLALLLYLQRAYAQSEAFASQSLVQAPGDTMARIVLAMSRAQHGARPAAERDLQALSSSRDDGIAIVAHALLALDYLADGNARAARAEQAQTDRIARRTGVVRDGAAIISIAAALGEQRKTDAAFAWLARIDLPSRKLFAGDPRLDHLRGDPRFRAWLRRA